MQRPFLAAVLMRLIPFVNPSWNGCQNSLSSLFAPAQTKLALLQQSPGSPTNLNVDQQPLTSLRVSGCCNMKKLAALLFASHAWQINQLEYDIVCIAAFCCKKSTDPRELQAAAVRWSDSSCLK